MTTLEDIKVMVVEETNKLLAIGLRPIAMHSITLVKAQSFYADCYRSSQGYDLRVSTYYLEAPVDEIRATIMHELTHAVPASGHGHGVAWKAVAAKVNKAYPQYNITRVGSNLKGGTSWSLRAACQSVSAKPLKAIEVKCPECGFTWTRSRESRLTLHPEWYRCHKCQVALVRI